MALQKCRRMWIEHFYPTGQEPDDPQVWRDAQSVLINEARGREELSEETRVLALTFEHALEKLQDTIDIATAEIKVARGVEWLEEATRRLEETRGEDSNRDEE